MDKKALLKVSLFSLLAIPISQAHAVDIDYGDSPPVNVDVELQLLIDVSGSISNSEYDLQMQGYSYALQDSAIQDAILGTGNGEYGQIAVQTVMWSSQSAQQVMTDWTLLDSTESITSYANTLADMSRPFYGATYNAEALDFGSATFADNGFEGTRNVIDMSGDGYGYDYLYSNYSFFSGGETSVARDNALNNGIDTINGLTITYDYNQVGDVDLTTWYSQNVIGGEDAFVLQAGDFTDFRSALSTKLFAEIEGDIIPTNAITPGEVFSAPAPIAGSGLLSLLMLGFCRLAGRRRQTQ
ncbi:DUF1194 domain-containing protein [Kiloniella sp. b19]|uniref:DUF1194 domain-containing protein n=1 Tax=Kiloniella sp. GXU_MW_B19 TaxID=3141326 RepID=UPI0031E0F549